MNVQTSGSYEDSVFINRIYDCASIAAKANTTKWLFFLDERQQFILQKCHLESYGCKAILFGGYDLAIRKMAAVIPSYLELQPVSPVFAVSYSYKTEAKLSHRDLLGALMAQNIKRELIGDILIEEARSVVFCHKNAVSVLINEIDKIGRWGVKSELGYLGKLPAPYTLQNTVIYVSSLRADCIVSAVTNISREKAVQLINQDFVAVNYQNISKPAYNLNFEDILSVRGYGKYILEKQLTVTKKGRLALSVNQYI